MNDSTPTSTTVDGRHVGHEIGDDHYFDVIVVGARCAGASTAMLLARAGLSVLVVDKTGYGADTTSTHALTRSAVLQLSRWGVLDSVREAGTPTVTSVEYDYGDDVVTIPIRPDGDVDGLYAPRRTTLDRILVDRAVFSGATVRHRTTLRSVRRDRNGRVNGVVIDGEHGAASVGAGLVIGADGARSTVARLVEAPLEYVAPATTTTVYSFVPGLPRDAYRNILQPGIVAGVIPTDDGDANVWVAVSQKRFRSEARRDPRAFYLRALAAADPPLAAHVGSSGVGRLRSFPGLPGFVRGAFGNGWALVGDACYFKDPISAHGITDALVGAELLAGGVIDIAAGRDEHSALADYAAQRWALTAPMMASIAHLASFEWTLDSARAAYLGISRAMRAEWDVVSRFSDRDVGALSSSARTG